jgi:hypothetical protein
MNGFDIKTPNYILKYDASDPLYMNIEFNNGLGGKLFVASGCDRDENIDMLVALDKPQIKETYGQIEISFTGKTTCWDKVVYTFTCLVDRILYGYTVYGKGRLENARFFEGFLADDPKMKEFFYPYINVLNITMPYKRPWKFFARSSARKFEKVYSFCINPADTREGMYYENMLIRVNSDRAYHGGDWLATPPPFIYLLNNKKETNWLSMGLLVNKGENNFCEFQYLGGEGFGFNLTYDGYTEVNGSWTSPKMMIVLHDTKDQYDVLNDYVSYLRENDYVPRKDRSNQPRWWHEPIFGGWGEQVYLSNYHQLCRTQKKEERVGCGTAGMAFCSREAYDKMLATLDENGVSPTILIVDNRWFHLDRMLDVDETIWPNMKEWIKEQHQKGRKVILWVSMFSHNPGKAGVDVPKHMCIPFDDRNTYTLEIDTNVLYKAFGKEAKKIRVPRKDAEQYKKGNYVVNPLNPEYQEYLRGKIQYLISPEGLDADGFEFDYTHYLWYFGHPRDLKLKLWGTELLRALTKFYHDEAKAVKEDALIISHTFNSYFDDCIDMLRLQDIYTDRAEVNEQFGHRAKVAQKVCPGCCIHTDQHPMPSLHAWRKYMPYQIEIGNPCLYYVTGIETTHEKFEECDWQMLRDLWSKYDEKLTAQYGPKKSNRLLCSKAKAAVGVD